MPSARYWISLNTVNDAEIIKYLDSFVDPRQRSWFIKEALREIIAREEREELEQFPYERLDAIEEWMKKLWYEMVELKKQRIAIAKMETPSDSGEVSSQDEQEIKKNISGLWSHKEK